jgi:hypothetical protein
MSNIFEIGPHVFNVFACGNAWQVSVDGILLEEIFPTRSDAWTAGVAEVERLAREDSSSPGPSP